MKGKPKPFLRNSEIDELCERLIYEYMGDDGAGKPVDIIGFTTGFLKLTILYARKSQFIPNARAIIEQNDFTESERKLHTELKAMAERIAELAHTGQETFIYQQDGGQSRFRNQGVYSAVYQDLKQPARTREQSVQTAKLLYELADCAIRCEVEQSMQTVQEEPV